MSIVVIVVSWAEIGVHMLNREFGFVFQENQLLMLLYYKTAIFDLHLLFPFQKR